MTAQASTEKSEERRRVVGRPFRKGRDPRRNAGAKKAEPEQPQDVRAWAKSVIDDPKVRAQVKRMAQRGELSAPLLKNLMERAAGIVKDAAQPQGESERDREARELAAGMRRNLSQDERLAMYSLLKKARGEDWKDGFEAVRRAQAGRAKEARAAGEEAARQAAGRGAPPQARPGRGARSTTGAAGAAGARGAAGDRPGPRGEPAGLA